MADKTDIWIYADWKGMQEAKCIGILSAHQAKGRKAFSFSYDPNWLHSEEQMLLDPDIAWYTGQQFPNKKENFGVFLDSMPDTWGRTLMKRRAALNSRKSGQTAAILHEIDYLLGVHDSCRMGGLRFKKDPDGEFLDNDSVSAVPPWAAIRDLQYSASLVESGRDSDEIGQWLAMLMAPGSSLGGARPKANILDTDGHLWIAKFPSKNDTVNKGAWEYLAYRLVQDAGIEMSPSKLEHVSGEYDTFFTQRFDRYYHDRIHFASAMTMTGNTEEMLRDKTPSYLEIAEFIQFSGSEPDKDLKQLWRRIVFHIYISNTDDHLRNHGFILTERGWRLSPAFDINPSVDKAGLAMNIDMDDNTKDIELAKKVGSLFRLDDLEMKEIIQEVETSVARWREVAKEIGIPRGEQTLMAAAFAV